MNKKKVMDIIDILVDLTLDNANYRSFQPNDFSKRNKKRMEPIESEHSLLSGHVVLRDKNIYMFLDTCVWINNADKGSFDLFAKLADLNEQKDAILLIPEQLRKEWDKNKREKLIINKRNEFNDMFKKTKKFRDIMITDNEKKMQLDTLITEAESVITEQIEYVNEGTISLIDQILDLGAPINTNDEIKLAATDMALQSMAPFHKNKNSMGDALLFQSLIDKLKEEKDAILYFVTDNKADFSEDKDRAPFKMHPDLLNMAQKHGIEIRYSLELSKTIDEIIEVVTDKEYLDECKKKYEDECEKYHQSRHADSKNVCDNCRETL
ncbi:PIN domain-containing protein [Bacillus cereus group sp. N24]|uniref:PIN domain-containing protein n=1 Tax=Bacillus cereus group sp. N24 TaxID=2794592 RepID=UPI0018F3D6E3|nr:PIN domain-containing protein [Bacillus cereus group sp. N24]MBJ7949995.1 DUF4935 domain-containing protein [Bacillus cereus group sp. N24]